MVLFCIPVSDFKKSIFLWISGIWETADFIVPCIQLAFQTAPILYFEVWKPCYLLHLLTHQPDCKKNNKKVIFPLQTWFNHPTITHAVCTSAQWRPCAPLLSIHRCGPSWKEASTVGITLQKSGLCLLQGLNYHTRGLPDRYCSTTQAKASAADGCGAWYSMMLPSMPLFSSFWDVLTQMGRVNRTGVKPCGCSILMEPQPAGLG